MLAAIVLAGGAGRRMGSAAKPLTPVQGVPMLQRVLRVLAGPTVVVGPSWLAGELPDGVLLTQEDPPGGGPVAAIAAGLALILGNREAAPGVQPGAWPAPDRVAVLAADLPFLTGEALAMLRLDGGDVAMFVDEGGRRQSLCAVWRVSALERRLAGIPTNGAAMRDLLAGADVREMSFAGTGFPPWFDCDTPQDVRRANGAG